MPNPKPAEAPELFQPIDKAKEPKKLGRPPKAKTIEGGVTVGEILVAADKRIEGGKAVAVARPAATDSNVIPATSLSEVLAIFERLATNPAVNPDTLGKLLDVQERLIDRQARMAFDQAFIVMQPELPAITKEGRIVVRAKDAQGKRTGEEQQNTPYAKWETIAPLIKPILAKHGFALSHRTQMTPEGRLKVTAVLRGHGWTDDSCSFELSADTTGSKNNNQAWGSSRSYGKRYTASDVLNLVTIGEDDDGTASGKPLVAGEPISAEQLAQIHELGAAVLCNAPWLLGHLNKIRPKNHPEIGKLADIPVSRFDETIAALRSYESSRAAREAYKAMK